MIQRILLISGVYMILFGWNLLILYQREEERKLWTLPPRGREGFVRDRLLLFGTMVQCLFQITVSSSKSKCSHSNWSLQHWCSSVIRTHHGFVQSSQGSIGTFLYFMNSLDQPSTLVALLSYLLGGFSLHCLLVRLLSSPLA
jgi:hypothetical protein